MEQRQAALQLEGLIRQINERKELVLNHFLSNSPHSDLVSAAELEEQVLGTLIDSMAAITDLIDLVHDGFFIEPKNQKVMSAIARIFGYSGNPDITEIVKELKKSNDFDFIGGDLYLAHLSSKKNRQ